MKIPTNILLLSLSFFLLLSSCGYDSEKLESWYVEKNIDKLENWKSETLEKKKLSPETLHNLWVVSYGLWKDSQENISLLEESKKYFSESLQKREHPDTRYNLEQIEKLLDKLSDTKSQAKDTSQKQENSEESLEWEKNSQDTKSSQWEENWDWEEMSEWEKSSEETWSWKTDNSSESTKWNWETDDNWEASNWEWDQSWVIQSPRSEEYIMWDNDWEEKLSQEELQALEKAAKNLNAEQEYYQQFFDKKWQENPQDIFEQFFWPQWWIFWDIKTEKEKDW